MVIDASAQNSSLPLRRHHDTVVIEFASDHALLTGILRACCDFITQDPEKTSARLEIVLREMLSNAIEHGNRNLRSRRVRCELTRIGKSETSIRVRDEGIGFPHHVLDLSTPHAPGCRLHRGLMLVKAFCDELHFNAAGNEISVRMTWDDTTNSEPDR
jgi:anti-sigma regulatory factor (Ser/Thr protein kinase)